MAKTKTINEQARADYKERTVDRMRNQAEALEANGDNRTAAMVRYVVRAFADDDNLVPLRQMQRLKRTPATIDEFIESNEFLGGQIDVWDTLRDDLRKMNPDVFVGATPVYEALMGGATATGKTIRADITTGYQLYLLTCFNEPQR